jgi:hypothetical protein
MLVSVRDGRGEGAGRFLAFVHQWRAVREYEILAVLT